MIQRSDRQRYIGWYVRVSRNGKISTKFFSDAEYGGKIKALHTAANQDAEWREIQSDVLKWNPQSNNTSGIRGVSRKRWFDERYKKFRNYWIAVWPGGSASINVDVYGEEKAKYMAVECRLAKTHLYRVR